jgi:hypothetical protein
VYFNTTFWYSSSLSHTDFSHSLTQRPCVKVEMRGQSEPVAWRWRIEERRKRIAAKMVELVSIICGFESML